MQRMTITLMKIIKSQFTQFKYKNVHLVQTINYYKYKY